MDNNQKGGLSAFVAGITKAVQTRRNNKGYEASRLVSVAELKAAIGDKAGIAFKCAVEVPFAGKAYEPKDTLTMPATTLQLPEFAITRGIGIVGKSGSGKTALIEQVLAGIIERGEAAVIHDPHGEYVGPFYDEGRGDVIFNAAAVQFPGWTIFNDLKSVRDCETLARVLFPAAVGTQDPLFVESPYDMCVALLVAIIDTEHTPQNADIHKVTDGGGKVIKSYCMKTSPGMCNALLADTEGNLALSFLASLRLALEPFRSLKDGPFSITDYLADTRGRQVFVTSQAYLRTVLAPINALFFELLGHLALSQTENEGRRLWLVLDDFSGLGKLAHVGKLANQGRKYGVSLVLAVQDFSQADKLYTQKARQAMFNSLATSAYFAVDDLGTAKEVADTIGEYKRPRNIQIWDSRDTSSLDERFIVSPLMLPSELIALRTFEHILKLDGYKPCRNILIPVQRP